VGGTILGLNRFLRHSTRPLTINVQANQGTVVVYQDGNGTRAVRPGDLPHGVSQSENVQTNATDTGLLLVYPPGSGEIVARIQVYGNSNVQIEEATSPRFRFNPDEQKLALRLVSGRLQLILPDSLEFPFVVEVETPQGAAVTVRRAGQYSFWVSPAETQVAVLEGEATVTANGAGVALQTDQRATIAEGGGPVGPLSSQRNLVQNGNFTDGLAEWLLFPAGLEQPDQPAGEVVVREISGEPRLHFGRVGEGHADLTVRQLIDQDVTDYESLHLQATMRVLNQDVEVCGSLGSECPLTIAIDYRDAAGADRTWQQGFYAFGETANNTPDVCTSCSAPFNEHIRVPLGQLVFYESGNLLEQLAQQNITVSFIKNIRLITAGHSFEAEVVAVDLLAEE
jgi:hypothetical protein